MSSVCKACVRFWPERCRRYIGESPYAVAMRVCSWDGNNGEKMLLWDCFCPCRLRQNECALAARMVGLHVLCAFIYSWVAVGDRLRRVVALHCELMLAGASRSEDASTQTQLRMPATVTRFGPLPPRWLHVLVRRTGLDAAAGSGVWGGDVLEEASHTTGTHHTTYVVVSLLVS
jgi:hypothetical protein